MEWISVKDKLPDKRDYSPNFLVMIDDTGYPPFIGWWDHSQKDKGGFMARIGSYTRRVVCTHYMYLPDWPERSKREDHESGCGTLNIEETQ